MISCLRDFFDWGSQRHWEQFCLSDFIVEESPFLLSKRNSTHLHSQSGVRSTTIGAVRRNSTRSSTSLLHGKCWDLRRKWSGHAFFLRLAFSLTTIVVPTTMLFQWSICSSGVSWMQDRQHFGVISGFLKNCASLPHHCHSFESCPKFMKIALSSFQVMGTKYVRKEETPAETKLGPTGTV